MHHEPSDDLDVPNPGAPRRRRRGLVALAVGVAAVTSLASGPAGAARPEQPIPAPVPDGTTVLPLDLPEPDPAPIETPASEATTEAVDAALADPGALDSVGSVAELEAGTADGTGVPITVVTDDPSTPGGPEVRLVNAPADSVDELIVELGAIDGVVTASRTGVVTETATDPVAYRQWGHTEVRSHLLPSTMDGLGTIVAVVDSGVQAQHPDLSPTLRNGQPRVRPGWTFLSGDPADDTATGNTDPRGHGTHVAGTIAAARDNGIGGAGVAPGVQILPVRVLDAQGAGYTNDVTAGIYYAHDLNADVINLSLSGSSHAPDVQAAINYVTTTNRPNGKPPSVVIASSGNSGPYSPVQYPAAYSSAIAVAASTPAHRVAAFSSWGDYVDIAAPGYQVIAPCVDGPATSNVYCIADGTSMAAPYVSAVAAILRQQSPNASPAVIRQTMQARARDVESPGWDRMTGWGVVDAAAAYDPWTYPPFPPVEVRLPWGYYNEARVEGRWIAVGGAAADLDGRPPVYLSSPTLGDRAVWPDANGNWWTSFQAPPGTHEVCATILDEPTRQGVWLGCNQLVVK